MMTMILEGRMSAYEKEMKETKQSVIKHLMQCEELEVSSVTSVGKPPIPD